MTTSTPAPVLPPSFPAPTTSRVEEHPVRSAVAVVVAGLVLVALLVGGGAVLANAVELAAWVGSGS